MNEGQSPPGTGDTLTVATRAWMEPERNDGSNRPSGLKRQASSIQTWRRSVVILDTETTTDPTQRLTFGVYRFGDWLEDGSLAVREEGLFHDDELPAADPDGYAVLRDFAARHEPETVGFERNRRLMLRSQADFLESVLWPAIQQDALIVCFNAPYDLSRLARDVSPARGRHQGGFSFVLWEYTNPETGKRREHQFRPRIRIMQIDSKRSRIDVTQPKGRPKGRNGKPVNYRPGFLDLRTLAFALTNCGYSLRSACAAFGVDEGKADAESHGRVTADYIGYARQDVKATASLLVALRADYDRHPIDLDPCRAMPPRASLNRITRRGGSFPAATPSPTFHRRYSDTP